MKKLRLTQQKSGIDRPLRQKRTLQALGLGKPGQVSEVTVTEPIAGMIAKISHLIKIEEI